MGVPSSTVRDTVAAYLLFAVRSSRTPRCVESLVMLARLPYGSGPGLPTHLLTWRKGPA
jgi:hypothetical protein